MTPCVIYLHCNAGNRLEAVPMARNLIINKISLFSFDFAGCGNSDGEYVTLGANESKDIQVIIKYMHFNKLLKELGRYPDFSVGEEYGGGYSYFVRKARPFYKRYTYRQCLFKSRVKINKYILILSYMHFNNIKFF